MKLATNTMSIRPYTSEYKAVYLGVYGRILQMGGQVYGRIIIIICNYEAKRHSPTCFGMQANHGGCLICCYTGYLGMFSSFLV